MTGKAAQNDIQSIVTTIVRAMNDVVQLQASRRTTAVDATAATISMPHQPGDARRNILIRALGRGRVDRSDVLRVAHRTLNGRSVDRDLRASAVLPALPAALAHRDRDLELRAAGRLRLRSAVEHRIA